MENYQEYKMTYNAKWKMIQNAVTQNAKWKMNQNTNDSDYNKENDS